MLLVIYAFLLVISFGGMVTFQLLFAPVLFSGLDMPVARRFLRRFFPFYYLYFGLLCAAAGVLAFTQVQLLDAALICLCTLGFVYARQVLMPKANSATDEGNKKRFAALHLGTVVINSVQMLILGYLIYSLFIRGHG